MNTTTLSSPFFEPRRLAWAGIALAVVGAGLLIPLAGDLKMQMRAVLTAGLAGLLAFSVLPNRRIALACAWVLAHPLSLEKVFPVFPPAYQGLMGTSVVVSGSDLVLYALATLLLLEAATSSHQVFFWPPAATPWAILTAWVCIIFFVTHPSATGVIQLIHWIKMLLYLVTLSSAIRTREELFTVLIAGAVAVLLQSAAVAWAYHTNRKVGFSSKVTSEAMMTFTAGEGESLTRATGTVGHVNQQAMFHTFFTIPLVGLLVVRNWIWRSFIALAMTASFCAILLTFSRASWLSCALASVIILSVAWKFGRISRAGWLAIFVGCLVGMVGLGGFSGKIMKRLTKGDDGATSSRLRMAELALEHISSNLAWGVGPGNFINAKLASSDPMNRLRNVWLPRGKSYLPRYLAGLELYEVEIRGQWYYMLGVVHNKVLLVTAELGLVGLSLFAWFQWRVFQAARSLLAARDRVLWWTGAGVFAAFFTTLTEFMLELFYDDKTVLLCLYVAVIAVAGSRILANETREVALA